MLAATWVTAGATVGLLIGAAITAFFAYMAWHTQLGALLTQGMELGALMRQHKRDADLHRRAQAAQVFIWLDQAESSSDLRSHQTVVAVRNSSQLPVYEVKVVLPAGGESIGHLMPGKQHILQDVGTQPADSAPTIQISFRDAAGLQWLTTSTGHLSELSERDAQTSDHERIAPRLRRIRSRFEDLLNRRR